MESCYLYKVVELLTEREKMKKYNVTTCFKSKVLGGDISKFNFGLEDFFQSYLLFKGDKEIEDFFRPYVFLFEDDKKIEIVVRQFDVFGMVRAEKVAKEQLIRLYQLKWLLDPWLVANGFSELEHDPASFNKIEMIVQDEEDSSAIHTEEVQSW